MTTTHPHTPLQQPPVLAHAVTLPLTGQFIIEASAGTGKTWTLTGILLRLLIEKGVPCDKIIATTFTRAAAAEMRERIRARLTMMLRVLRLCTQALGKISLDDIKITANDSRYNTFLHELETLAIRDNLTEQVQGDAIHWHLVTQIAKQFFASTNPVSDNVIAPVAMQQDSENNATAYADKTNNKADEGKNGEDKHNTPEQIATPAKPIDFRIAILRTTMALNQLDRLFVGTLDSLCQKWLREFSAETGYSPNIAVNTQPDNVIMDLVHDQVRAYRSWLASESPELFEIMLDNKLLATAEDYLPAIQKSLTFYSTPIDPLTLPSLEVGDIFTSLQEFLNLASSQAELANEATAQFSAYLDKEYRVAQGFTGNVKLHTRFDSYQPLYQLLHERGLAGLQAVDDYTTEWLASIVEAETLNKGFKKGFDSQRQQFLANPITQQLIQVYTAKRRLDNVINQVHQFFSQYISRYIKTQLPLVLESRGQTTFSLQLARLNQALEGKQGKLLARYIRHQYPVMLVDESQDINTEQAMMLQRVYLTGVSTGFLLLVGDPKQAIYGFRGGDVSNYTAIKSQFSQKPLALTQNFRSSQAVITALNHWFGVPDSETDREIESQISPTPLTNQPYSLGQQINYRYIQAARLESNLTQTSEDNTATPGVFLLSVPLNTPLQESLSDTASATAQGKLEENFDYAAVIAAQILALCDTEQDYRYQGKRLQLKHICVLADTNRQLDKIEKALAQKAIASIRGGTQSLFSGQMTQDVIALMHAMLYPYDMTRLRRLLMSAFFGLDLAAVNALFMQHEAQTEPQIAAIAIPTTIKSHLGSKEPNADLALPFSLSSIQSIITEANKLWLSQGFLTAVQWLLNQRFMSPEVKKTHAKNPQPPPMPMAEGISFWQRLASMIEGERLLIDLRQLLDIISQTTRGMGEHQLLQWLERLASEQPKEEWSMQQRLSSETGVHLMTIHQSKGLEFEVVFVVGLDKKLKPNRQKYPLYLYSLPSAQTHDPLQHRRLSVVASDATQDFASQEVQANFEEKLRLAYVAFTRAKDRLYIVAQENARNDSLVPLNHWLEGKSFALPERLQAPIAVVNINSLSKYFSSNLKYTTLKDKVTTSTIDNTTNTTDAIDDDNFQTVRTLADYTAWINSITQTQFLGWSNTSFTALSRQLNHNKRDIAINEPDYDNMLWDNLSQDDGMWDEMPVTQMAWHQENDVPSEFSNTADESNPIDKTQNTPKLLRFYFEKGTNAGTFLHKILENLPAISSAELQSMASALPSNTNLQTAAEDFAIFDNPMHFTDYADSDAHRDDIDDQNFSIDINAQDFYDEPPYQTVPDFNFADAWATHAELHSDDTSSLFWHWHNEAIFETRQFNKLLSENRYILIGEGSGWQPFLAGLPASWQTVIDRAVDNYQISPQYRSHPRVLANQPNTSYTDQVAEISADYVALVAWLYHIVQTPLLASQIPLNAIVAKQKIHELSFNMSLRRDFSIAMMNELFAIEGVTMTLYDHREMSHYWRYLRGEIDLVYQHQSKFFVVDYKSNYLGDSFEAYHTTALEVAMNEHGYWLQAAIYQVALHRYLQLRLPKYDIHTHLGGVEYVFLRGMHPDKPDYGRLLWQPSPTFILALDMLLGRAE